MRCSYRWLAYGIGASGVLALTAAAGGGPPAGVHGSGADSRGATTRPVFQRVMGALGISPPMAAMAPSQPLDMNNVASASNPEPVEPDIRVSARGEVEMHVADLDLAKVLQVLSLQSRRNIIASKEVSGKVTANLYDVTMAEALDAILCANDCGWRESGDFIYVYTRGELAAMEAAAHPPISRVFRLKYVAADDVSKLVQPLLGKEGKITVSPKASSGVAEGAKEAGGNSLADTDCLIVFDTPGRLEAIAKVIDEIDVRPKQVLIEATILRAQLNEDTSLGVDFNILCGVNFEQLNSLSPGITSLETGFLPQPQMPNTNMTFRTDFNSAVPDGGFTFGIVKDSVAVFVRALEEVTDTAILANPKVLALNKQRGEILVGRRDGYLTTTVTETTATQTVQFLDTGTKLIFRPFIGDDGYIRMEIHPKDSTGGLTASNLPFEQTTEVTTNVMLRDGNTILIGGLFREVTTASRGQLPYFGNLPIAGMLLRTTHDATQREEVIILLTVHILKEDDKFAEMSRRLAEDVERYRVGMRQGLQCFGRERLAQAHYHWAVEHLEKGDEGRALWDARIAAYLNPMFLAAIELTEKLSNKRAWDDDGSAVRDFVVRLIEREKGTHASLYGRPGPPFVVPENLHGPNGFEEPCEETPAAPAGRQGESEASS